MPFSIKNERKHVSHFAENCNFVLYAIFIAHLLKGYGSGIFAANLAA
jgi:hypothetical protein